MNAGNYSLLELELLLVCSSFPGFSMIRFSLSISNLSKLNFTKIFHTEKYPFSKSSTNGAESFSFILLFISFKYSDVVFSL